MVWKRFHIIYLPKDLIIATTSNSLRYNINNNMICLFLFYSIDNNIIYFYIDCE